MPSDPRRFDDLFASFGEVAVRRMFGGEGLFRNGVMFGLVFGERIYLKTGEEGRQAFLAEGSEPFTYRLKKGGDMISRHYYTLPDRLYDDPDELAQWARAALAAAMKSPGVAKRGRAKAGTGPRKLKGR